MSEQKNKIPPHNEEAEQATLGAMLLDEAAVATVLQYLRPDDFYFNANRRVCEAIFTVSDAGHKADLLTVTGELQKKGMLDEAGGLDYVASLGNTVPSTANVEYYAQVVQDCSLKRALIRIAGTVGIEAYNETTEARPLLEETEQKLLSLYDKGQTTAVTRVSDKDFIKKAMEKIHTAYKEKNPITGVPSGFDDLDKMTGGFQPADLIVIGARPSRGKTALALTMASHISIESKIPAAFFTLEMSDQALMMRIISSEARIASQKLRSGFFPQNEFPRIWEAFDKLSQEVPLYIVDMPNIRLMDLRAQARRLRAQEKVKIIFIDYLGLIASENIRIPRHEQMAEISRSLKGLARELGIPIVVLSQLTREAEKERASLASIRESGAIEQDADVVMFIQDQREMDKSPEEQAREEGREVELMLMKQRNGPTGPVKLVFMKQYTRFESYAGDKMLG
ncbi:MAG: replicative DNA helicase [Treponematales bacterium]